MRTSPIYAGALAAGMAMLAGVFAQTPPDAQPDATLAEAAEMAALSRVRTDQKMARDLWEELARSAGIPAFFEALHTQQQRQMAALGVLIAKRGLTDPLTGAEPGKFATADDTRRYRKALQFAKLSKLNAFKTGAESQEALILGYRQLGGVTGHEPTRQLANAWVKQAEAHLQTFYKRIKKNGTVYSPRFLEREDFDRIIGSAR